MKKTLLLILAGVGLGLLLAPNKGSETWNNLLDTLADWRDEAADQAADLRDKGEDLGRTASRRARDLV